MMAKSFLKYRQKAHKPEVMILCNLFQNQNVGNVDGVGMSGVGYNSKEGIMKKILSAILIILFFAFAVNAGDTWYAANQGAFTWDPVTTMEDGSVVIPGQLTYRLYIKLEGTGEITEAGEVAGPPVTLTFDRDGKHRVGVKVIRMVDGEIVSASKDISWSDDPVFCENGETFGFTSWQRPLPVRNLRLPVEPETPEQK